MGWGGGSGEWGWGGDVAIFGLYWPSVLGVTFKTGYFFIFIYLFIYLFLSIEILGIFVGIVGIGARTFC